MSHIYKNIITTDATLLSPVSLDQGGSGPAVYNQISIVNTSASYKYSFDLYITRTKKSSDETRSFVGQNGNWDALSTTTQTYYLMKTVNIPVGTTLVLEAEDLLFDSKKFDFYIKINDITGSGVTVDVNINMGGTSSSSSGY